MTASLSPLFPSRETRRDCVPGSCREQELHQIQQRGRQMQQAERSSYSSALGQLQAHAATEEPAPALQDSRRRMVAAAMVEEFLAVIGGEGHDAVFPHAQASQRVHQARHLRIDPANPGVVESNDVFAVPPQPRRSQVATVPVRIQVARPRGIQRIAAPSVQAPRVAGSRANADP